MNYEKKYLFQKDEGQFVGEESGMNGIELICGAPGSTDFMGVANSLYGVWGEWKEPQACDSTITPDP